ncbi:MAG: hypothetical protein U0R23_06740 [Candidatus Nanopelagicales bacterium]
MKRVVGFFAAGAVLIPASPAAAEPVPVDEAVAQLNAACVASRDAFLDGGVVRLRTTPEGEPVQVQRLDARAGRVSDTGWPAVTARGLGTYDRSGFVLDARLRKAQIAEAAGYLGFRKRPWVLARGQFGVIASRSYRQFLRMDLLAPDRLVDLDSTMVPAQPQRCASHLSSASAKARIDRTVADGATTWSLSYRLDDGITVVRVASNVVVRDGLIVSGSAILRGQRGSGVDLDNFAQWTYAQQRVPLPAKGRVVSQRQWIRATDAAALVTDLRYLSGSLEGRQTLTGLRRAARQQIRLANRGHEVLLRVRNVPDGVVLYGRNPFTARTVAFQVVLQPEPTAVSRRIS